MALPLPVQAIFFVLLFYSLSYATRHEHHHRHNLKQNQSPPTSLIHDVCKASHDPPTCEASLINSRHGPPSNSTVVQVIGSAVEVSMENLKTAQSMVNEILEESKGNLNRTNAAKQCTEVMGYSEYRMESTVDVLPRGDRIKDSRAWMSAAMAYQYDCWSSLKYVNVSVKVNETMSFLNSLMGFISNALGMMWNYDNFGDQTVSWGVPKTERDGVWERLGGSGDGSGHVGGGVPSGLKPDVTVCKSGGCDYRTVQEAVNAAPKNVGVTGKRFVIGIKAGVYEETVRVPLETRNVVFFGDGMGKTVITGSMNVGGQLGMSTYNSATVAVVGDGFMATGLTIQNTAGPNAHQAVAFRSDSDLSIIENCEFLGNQDTLYAHTLRQYYKSCRIQGNIDFIFGNSAAFFDNCLILVSPRQLNPEQGEENKVTAHGRIDPAQSTGFVFQNSVINGTSDYMALYYKNSTVHKSFLGRPWKDYSRTVFIQCTLGALITQDGWLAWNSSLALSKLYFGEFQNRGPGAIISARVPWSSQIPRDHVNSYSVQSFIQGNKWLPTSSS